MSYADTLVRQLDIIPLDKLGVDVTIIGAGAIGSWATLALAKMGFLNLTVWDFDEVDTVNMNCQFYPMSAVGTKKVEALFQMVKLFTEQDIKVRDAFYKSEYLNTDIIISAADSMAVRKNIYEANTSARWIIDSRMASEQMILYVVDLADKQQRINYEKTLHSDDDAVGEKCTGKSTIYCANILSGLVAKAVKNIATGGEYTPIIMYNLKREGYFSTKRLI